MADTTTVHAAITVTAENIGAISGATVLLTGLCKWALPAHLARQSEALLVAGISAVGVSAWYVSSGATFGAQDVWPLLALWVAICAACAGLFGFVRANGSKDLALGQPLLPGRGRERWSAGQADADHSTGHNKETGE